MAGLAPEQYKETLLFLATAGLIVPVFRRLQISPVIGFLSAGAALGPHGLGSIAQNVGFLSVFALDNVQVIEPIAEFGVVFLLFTIGLELTWERLTRLRRLVFGFGLVQLLTSAAVLGLLALALGQPAGAAAILGAGLALSSTAVVIPVMAERRRLATAAGRSVFSVLLFQDLMVAPLLVLVSMLSLRTGSSSIGLTLLYTLLPALSGLLVLVGGGRLLLRPLFHHVASAGSTEFFMGACLFVVIGTGVLTASTGLSMGLGAFIAGLLLAETEFRREIEVTIEPFKGLLLGLFFVAVGASLDISQLVTKPGPTLGLAFGFILIKVVMTYGAARLFKLPWRVSLESALMLAPGGEFAFVLVAAATEGHVIATQTGAYVNVAVTLSLFAIPAFAALSRRLVKRIPRSDAPLARIPVVEGDKTQRALLIGYGRVGQLVGEMMRKHGITYLAVDDNVATVRTFRRQGVSITWGNARRIELLERCGLAKIEALIITLDDADLAEAIVTDVRARRPELTIVARARDAERAASLYELGVTDAVPETIEASLQLSEAVLADMGVPMGLVIASIHEKRDEFRKVLQPVTPRAKEKRAIRMSQRVKDMKKRSENVRAKPMGAPADT